MPPTEPKPPAKSKRKITSPGQVASASSPKPLAKPLVPPASEAWAYGADPTRPGFGIGVDRGSSGVGYSMSDYDTWLTNMSADAGFAAMRAKYGDDYVKFEWDAMRLNMDGITYQNQLMMKFPGFTDIKLPGSGGGGRGGGGGGGGTAAPTPEQIEAAKAAVKNRAGELGRPLTDDELTFVATTIVRDGWNSAQLDDWLLGEPGKVTDPGLVTASVDQIRQMAANQLLTVSDETARGWAERINSGEMTTDAVMSIFQAQALGEFGWAAESIKAGIGMRDMLAPARDQIAKELELTPETVDLMDPKWRGMVTTTDPKTGAVRAATLSEVTRSARKAPEWAKTNSSKSLAANTFMLVRQMFEG